MSAILKDHLPTMRSLGVMALVVGAVLWVIWVSVRLTAPNEQKIVQVRMSQIMREFIDAQAKDDTDPQVTRQAIARYLEATDQAVDDLSRSGHVILVAEAVLSKNTPDATLLLKNTIAEKLAKPRAEEPR